MFQLRQPQFVISPTFVGFLLLPLRDVGECADALLTHDGWHFTFSQTFGNECRCVALKFYSCAISGACALRESSLGGRASCSRHDVVFKGEPGGLFLSLWRILVVSVISCGTKVLVSVDKTHLNDIS